MKTIVYITLLMFLYSCGYVYERHITGNYYLIAVDAMDDLSVSYTNKDGSSQGISGGGVYEMGNDEHFILTKQYKEIKDSTEMRFPECDKNITEYYIIPVDNTQMSWEAQENCFGPLTKEEFEAKRKELGVPSTITFEKIR